MFSRGIFGGSAGCQESTFWFLPGEKNVDDKGWRGKTTDADGQGSNRGGEDDGRDVHIPGKEKSMQTG